jgi:hypothetical protein
MLITVADAHVRSCRALAPFWVAGTVPGTGVNCAAGSRRPRFSGSVLFKGPSGPLQEYRRCGWGPGARPSSVGEGRYEDSLDSRQQDPTAALIKALLLSFLASQNRSFFASKSFVETVMVMYDKGYTLDAIKNAATFGTISSGSMNEPKMLDVMLAWVACVYVTLDELKKQEVGGDGVTAGKVSEESGSVKALRDMAKVWIQKFNEDDLTFEGLLLQQNMQEMSQQGSAGEFLRVMQQNARLVLLTLEMLRTGKQAEGNLDFSMPGFVNGMLDIPQDPLDYEDRVSCRSLAVSLLLAFNAAALGYLVGARAFVETAAHMYVCGWTADEVYLSLKKDEFEQGGGFQVRVARPPGGTSVSSALFVRWLSIVYMTMAKLGVAHPKAADAEGWAWVCSLQDQGQDGAKSVDDVGGSLEAHGVYDFVLHTLREKMESESEEEEIDLDAPPKDYFEGFTFKFEDPDLMMVSSFGLVLVQQVSLVEMTKEMVDARLRLDSVN